MPLFSRPNPKEPEGFWAIHRGSVLKILRNVEKKLNDPRRSSSVHYHLNQHKSYIIGCVGASIDYTQRYQEFTYTDSDFHPWLCIWVEGGGKDEPEFGIDVRNPDETIRKSAKTPDEIKQILHQLGLL